MYTTPIQIRFNDVDQMGHVNNAVIMEYFDLGKSNYFSAVGVPPELNDFTVMIVHYDVDFKAQVRYYDNLSVQTYCSKFGNKSLEITQTLVKENGEVCVVCKAVMAGYSRSQKSSALIPEEIKEKIRQLDAE